MQAIIVDTRKMRPVMDAYQILGRRIVPLGQSWGGGGEKECARQRRHDYEMRLRMNED